MSKNSKAKAKIEAHIALTKIIDEKYRYIPVDPKKAEQDLLKQIETELISQKCKEFVTGKLTNSTFKVNPENNYFKVDVLQQNMQLPVIDHSKQSDTRFYKSRSALCLNRKEMMKHNYIMEEFNDHMNIELNNIKQKFAVFTKDSQANSENSNNINTFLNATGSSNPHFLKNDKFFEDSQHYSNLGNNKR